MSTQATPQTGPAPEPELPPRPASRGRLVIPVLSGVVAVALIALLGFGLVSRAPDTRIDDSLARNTAVSAPGYRLAVLRRGRLGALLERRVGPALADGFVSPAELVGTSYVLNIWASWCVPCRSEAPELVRAWKHSRPKGVLFVGLDMQDATEDAGRFLEAFGIDYLNIRDPTNDTSRRYGATGIPETFFISARGEIVNHVIGAITPAQLQTGIMAAVAGRPRAASLGGDQRSTR